jgi:ATP-binding cassette, subfamily B, bacterial
VVSALPKPKIEELLSVEFSARAYLNRARAGSVARKHRGGNANARVVMNFPATVILAPMLWSFYSSALRFAWSYWRRWPRAIGTILFTRIGSTLIDVSVPVAAGHMVQAVASGAGSRAAYIALATMLALSASFHVIRYLNSRLWTWLAANVLRDVVYDGFAKVQRFSADWHANAFAGATVRKITRGMWAFDTFGDTLMYGLIPASVVSLGVTALFAWRWPVLGLVVGIGIVIFVCVSVWLSVGWVAPAAQRAQESDSRIGGYLADTIGANAVVKAFGAEAREEQRFARIAKRWRHRSLVAWNRSLDTGLAQSGILLLLQASLLSCGLWLWLQGRATPGDIAYLVATQFLINGYLRDVGQQVRNLQKSINEMSDIIDFNAERPEVRDAPAASALSVPHGRIQFDNVSFRYAGAGAPLYEALNIDIHPGERVGLVGHSGSGKSTFVKLIQRLYDLDGGRILIDGQDIAQVTQQSLRRAIGLVPQEAILFHRSLSENIAYGRPRASDSDIAHSARLAHAHEFIETLPRRYATPVGERGIKLSGGERQRVAIARAILAATPILILDEATSSLDSISESLIRDALDKLIAGRTTLVIAHRLSTVQRLDRILVFDHGRIIEQGTHAELMARAGGHYRKLFEVQTTDMIFNP